MPSPPPLFTLEGVDAEATEPEPISPIAPESRGDTDRETLDTSSQDCREATPSLEDDAEVTINPHTLQIGTCPA